MNWIADRTQAFDSSGIRKVFDLAAKMTDPINLSIGQPEFEVPKPVQDACIDAIREGKNGYALTQGMPVLRDKLQAEIDATNESTYQLLNNGVYRCGFSTQQSAYDQASSDVRKGLQRCEEILQKQNYLCGDAFTEADLRLLPTVLRFDGAYAPLFKVCKKASDWCFRARDDLLTLTSLSYKGWWRSHTDWKLPGH